MPLNNIPYNVTQGEWYPYNADNYTDRARAMMFFNSLNNSSDLYNGSITLKRLIEVTETNTTSNWPLGTVVTYSSGEPVYAIFYIPSIPLNFQVILYKPTTGSSPEDQALYDEYLDNLDNLSESNFTGFDFGRIQYGEIDFDDPSHKTTVNDIQKFDQETQCVYAMTLDTPFPADSPLSAGFNYEAGIMEWNAEYNDESRIGNFIEINGTPINPAVGSYIMVTDDDTGEVTRYQITEILTSTTGLACLRVKPTDGSIFPTDANVTIDSSDIDNITSRPRLKIRYRVPVPSGSGGGGGGGGGSPTTTYKIYSTPDGSNYKLLSGSSTKRIRDGDLASPELLFDQDARIFTVGGSHTINGPNFGPFNFGVPTTTTTDGGVTTRLTPWRKAYRSINRFTPREITFRQTRTGESPLDGTIKYNLKRGPAIPVNDMDNLDFTFPLAIPHRPAALQWKVYANGGHGNNQILIDNDVESREYNGNVHFQGSDPNFPNFVWDANQWIDPSSDGYVIDELNDPNVISFTVNKNDQSSEGVGRFNYDYNGKVSCKETVIPAYSGEILYFDPSTDGFIVNNYALPSSGGIASTVVFIDITETDEVLRWSGSNYDPVDAWRNTFGDLIMTKNGANDITLNNHAVIKTDKDNYVVAMYSDADYTIADGDNIQITMVDKQVITNPESNLLPASSEYGPIVYRDMDKEHIDDHRRELVASALSDFTISSDGTVDGNITINYDGDVPDGTQFRLFIQEDEEESP